MYKRTKENNRLSEKAGEHSSALLIVMRFPLVARGCRSTGNGVVRGGAGCSFSILPFELSLLLAIARLLVGGSSLGLHKMTEQTHVCRRGNQTPSS